MTDPTQVDERACRAQTEPDDHNALSPVHGNEQCDAPSSLMNTTRPPLSDLGGDGYSSPFYQVSSKHALFRDT